MPTTHPPPPTPSLGALVAGPATPTGEALVRDLTAAGWRVATADPAPVATARRGAPRAAVARELVSAAEAEVGPIWLLVTTVDDDRPVALEDLTAGDLGRAVALHLEAPLALWRAALPGMLDRGHGSIVAVLPADAVGGHGAAHRAAAVGAVTGAVRALAREVGPQGIVVNAVAPGRADGPAGAALVDDASRTIVHLAGEPHYFAGQVLTPSGEVYA